MDVIEMLKGLFFDQNEQEKWAEDPEAYLEEKGATDLTVAQINEAAQLVNRPVDLGAEVNVGGNQTVGHVGDTNVDCDTEEVDEATVAAFAESLDRGLRDTGPAAEAAPAAAPAPASEPYVAPPPPPAPAPATPPVQQIEETINYYVTNVTETHVDDRDTYVDNSVGDILNVGGTVDIDQETTVASGDGAVAQDTDGGDAGPVNTGERGVAQDTGGGDAGPVTTGDGNTVVDNRTSDGGEGGNVTIGDDNENNEVDIDFGEGGASGPVNVGVGSGDTSQDNHTEDNDGVDIDDNSQDNDGVDIDDSFQDNSQDNDGVDIDDSFQDNDGVDYDDNDGIDYDDQDLVDYDDQDLVDDKDLIDADLGFGAGRTLAPERARLTEEVVAEAAPEPEYTTDMGMPEQPKVAQLVETVEVVEIVEAPVEMEEILPEPEPVPVEAEAELVDLVEE